MDGTSSNLNNFIKNVIFQDLPETLLQSINSRCLNVEKASGVADFEKLKFSFFFYFIEHTFLDSFY